MLVPVSSKCEGCGAKLGAPEPGASTVECVYCHAQYEVRGAEERDAPPPSAYAPPPVAPFAPPPQVFAPPPQHVIVVKPRVPIWPFVLPAVVTLGGIVSATAISRQAKDAVRVAQAQATATKAGPASKGGACAPGDPLCSEAATPAPVPTVPAPTSTKAAAAVKGKGTDPLASASAKVPSFTLSASTVKVGAPFTARFNAPIPQTNRYWITVQKVGTPDGTLGGWGYQTTGAKQAQLRAGDEGPHEVRLLDRVEGDRVIARAHVTATR